MKPFIDSEFFFTRLYPLQDRALQIIDQAGTDFYLTGGTALSRGYLHHRFSDDLDLFANLSPRFSSWCEQVVMTLAANPAWQTKVTMRQEYFMRIFVTQDDVTLKIECVNDVPSHIGEINHHAILGRLDSPENILANKLTALLGRNEPKDVADVWALTLGLGLSIKDAITGAQSKAAGLYPPDLARRLFQVTQQDWATVRWITPPDPEQFIREVKDLAESLILV
jgi:hypothetical protein